MPLTAAAIELANSATTIAPTTPGDATADPAAARGHAARRRNRC
jgi:hypothetical protein